MTIANATPLIALDAVVLDTETTGLDPAKSNLIEIGAIRLRAGRIDETGSYRRLIRPPQPVPAQSTAIHGIDDAALAAGNRDISRRHAANRTFHRIRSGDPRE
jgi:DNA polymerase-3 subunit epsilon/CBS domain-containing protein